MAIAMYMQFPNVTREQYDNVLKDLKLREKMPDGLHYHVAGPMGNEWCVMDVWESQAHFDRYYKERLHSALQRAGIEGAPPPKVFPVHNVLGQAAMSGR